MLPPVYYFTDIQLAFLYAGTRVWKPDHFTLAVISNGAVEVPTKESRQRKDKICEILTTVKPVFKTTWEIGATWELRTATSVPRSMQHIEMDLRNKTTSEFRTVLDSPFGVPNSQVPLYLFN